MTATPTPHRGGRPATQARAARAVQTNQKRVEATRASRTLAERRLEAEEKKFQAGMSTSFFVFQAQRDLSQARANELRAITDYNRSIVDYETVQEAPLGGGGAAGGFINTGGVGGGGAGANTGNGGTGRVSFPARMPWMISS